MTAKDCGRQSVEEDDLLSDERLHVPGTGDIEAASAHSLLDPEVSEGKWTAKFKALSRPVSRLHQRTPFLKRLPAFVLFPITILILVNCLVWAIIGIILRYHPAIAGPVTLTYTFGLRHGLDADHIAAIDNVSRKLVALGQTPGTVGTFFSLGHSTVVIIITIIVAATSAALAEKFDTFKKVGGIIGVGVSCSFLLIIALANIFVLAGQVRTYRILKAQKLLPPDQRSTNDEILQHMGGKMTRIFNKCFKFIDRPWKMYPLGFMFGLGFDTSTEVALLGIASIEATKGTSFWLLLLFPLVFTCGMCLVGTFSLEIDIDLDTTDGALMTLLYVSPGGGTRGPSMTRLFHSMLLTSLSIGIAITIGIIQLLSLVYNVKEPEGAFWDGVQWISDRYDIVGGLICAAFIVIGIGGVVTGKIIRKRRRRQRQRQQEEAQHI